MTYTDNIIPAMTSYTEPSGVVSASGFINATSAEWMAFDNQYDVVGWLDDAGTGWLQYQFPVVHAVTQYAVTSIGGGAWCAPKTWSFEGSNNGSTWDTLDTQTNVTDWASTGGVRKVFSFANSTAYAYYRINITVGSDAGYVGVGELEMMETVETARWFRRRGRNGQPDRVMRMKG